MKKKSPLEVSALISLHTKFKRKEEILGKKKTKTKKSSLEVSALFKSLRQIYEKS